MRQPIGNVWAGGYAAQIMTNVLRANGVEVQEYLVENALRSLGPKKTAKQRVIKIDVGHHVYEGFKYPHLRSAAERE
jgi:peroxiredoxin family protein